MTVIQGFDIRETLYSGEHTAVVSAVKKADGKSVVIKSPAASFAGLKTSERYRQEYDILMQLESCPHVLDCLALEHHDGRPCLILEDFGGVSLKGLINKGGLRLEQCIAAASEIAAALDDIFQAGIIHKDVKPSNILLNPETGQLKLCDFSSATVISKEAPSIEQYAFMTATLPYMSPEQTGRMNRLVDWRMDYYSLGVSLYELFTGRLPFQAVEPIELVHAHMTVTPPPVHEINPEIPPVISDIVSRLMAKDAENRYQSAYGIKADLDRCHEGFKKLEAIDDFA